MDNNTELINQAIEETIAGLITPQNDTWQKGDIKTPFAYAGGKVLLARAILENSPKMPHVNAIVAPFGGSGVELINQSHIMRELGFRPYESVVYGDADKRLRYFWQALRETPRELLQAICFTPYSYEEYRRAIKVNFDDPSISVVEKARAYFVTVTQTIGRIATTAPRGWYNNTAARTKSRIQSSNDHLADFTLIYNEVRNWTLDERLSDYRHAVKAYDMTDAYLYLDPPYLLPKDARARANASGMYEHEFSRDDYYAFTAAVGKVAKAAVTVMGHKSEEMDELFPTAQGWDCLALKTAKPSIGKAVNEGGLLRTTCMYRNHRCSQLARLSAVNVSLF